MNEVEEFIETFLNKHNLAGELETQFANGFCYHFALMLKGLFNRGEIVWAAPFGHIMWKDVDGVSYDIYGAYGSEYDYSNNNNSFSPENSESNDDLFGELKEQYDIDFNSKESMEDNDNFLSQLPDFLNYNQIDGFDSPKINSLPPFSPSNVIDSNQIIQKNQEIKPKIEKDQSPKENKPKKKRKRKRENNKDSKKKFNNHEIKKSKGIIRNSIRKFINNVLLRAYNHNYR